MWAISKHLSCFAQLLRLLKIEDESHAKLRVSVDVRLSQRMPMKNCVAVIKIAFFGKPYGGLGEQLRHIVSGRKTRFLNETRLQF